MKYTKTEIFGLSILTLIGAALLYMGVSIAHAGPSIESVHTQEDLVVMVEECKQEVISQYEGESEALIMELLQECETDTTEQL